MLQTLLLEIAQLDLDRCKWVDVMQLVVQLWVALECIKIEQVPEADIMVLICNLQQVQEDSLK
jgi:hypothetical protein